MKRSYLISLTAIILSFAVSFYFQGMLPEKVVTHWNVAGQPDGYSSNTFGLFMFPIMLTVMSLVYLTVPKIDPLKKNLMKFWKYFEGFIIIIFAFLIYLQILVFTWNVGFQFDFTKLLVPAFSILFYYIGLLMEKSRRNWFIGIRTPWTLSSDSVWGKTNKLSGKLFRTSAGVLLLGFFSPKLFFLIIMLVAFILAFVPIVYSFFEYRKVKK